MNDFGMILTVEILLRNLYDPLRGVMLVKKKDFGILNEYVEKLGNQISLGISVNRALNNFANETGSKVIKRAIELISEAERAGGEIEYILESVSKSIAEVEKLKKERKLKLFNFIVIFGKKKKIIIFLFLEYF